MTGGIGASLSTGEPPSEVLFRLAIGPAVAVFLPLAIADHLLAAAPGVHRWYETSLERRANYARWIEYSVSAVPWVAICWYVAGAPRVPGFVSAHLTRR